MIKKVLLIDVENLQRDNCNVTDQWFSQYPLGVMYLSAAVKLKFPSVEFKIFHTFTSQINTLLPVVHTHQFRIVKF